MSLRKRVLREMLIKDRRVSSWYISKALPRSKNARRCPQLDSIAPRVPSRTTRKEYIISSTPCDAVPVLLYIARCKQHHLHCLVHNSRVNAIRTKQQNL